MSYFFLFQIERITNTPHNRNLPLYLRPHARKLRRSSISRNIDKIAVHSFAKGQRSSGRRTAILSDSPGKTLSAKGNIRRATKSQAVRIKDGIGINGNSMRQKQVHSDLDRYRINMNRDMELIEEVWKIYALPLRWVYFEGAESYTGS